VKARFRSTRRLFPLQFLVSGLLPLGLGSVFFKTVVDGALSMAPPLEDVLEKSFVHLKGTGADPALIADLQQARLNLVQAGA
jgi:hypothetical protein